jgi:hypothetical protein
LLHVVMIAHVCHHGNAGFGAQSSTTTCETRR